MSSTDVTKLGAQIKIFEKGTKLWIVREWDNTSIEVKDTNICLKTPKLGIFNKLDIPTIWDYRVKEKELLLGDVPSKFKIHCLEEFADDAKELLLDECVLEEPLVTICIDSTWDYRKFEDWLNEYNNYAIKNKIIIDRGHKILMYKNKDHVKWINDNIKSINGIYEQNSNTNVITLLHSNKIKYNGKSKALKIKCTYPDTDTE
jgi:hypothetical protein